MNRESSEAVSADQVELEFAIPQPTHYDSPGGALSEITVNNPGEDGPQASRVLLARGTFVMSILLLVSVEKSRLLRIDSERWTHTLLLVYKE